MLTSMVVGDSDGALEHSVLSVWRVPDAGQGDGWQAQVREHSAGSKQDPAAGRAQRAIPRCGKREIETMARASR